MRLSVFLRYRRHPGPDCRFRCRVHGVHLPTATQPTFFCAASFRGFVLGLDAASVIKVDAPVDPVSVEFLAERTTTFAEGFALRGDLFRLVGRQRGAG